MNSYPIGSRRVESRMKKIDDLYTILLKIYYTLYTIKLKICTQRFYYSKFSKFIQGKSHLLQQPASVSLLKEQSKMCPKLIELLQWSGPTIHVYCFMLARASTKTFVSLIHIRQPSPKNNGKIFISRKIRQQGHSLADVSLYTVDIKTDPKNNSGILKYMYSCG